LYLTIPVYTGYSGDTTDKTSEPVVRLLDMEAVMAEKVEALNKREGRRPRELARQLDLHPSVIYDAIAAGEFGTVWRFGSSGRAIVIPEEAVQAWLASKQVGSREAIA
jgi:predicted DNA-binding transcriptional regulator AlpA